MNKDTQLPLQTKDYFITRGGKRYAGIHLLIDLHGASHLSDMAYIEKTCPDDRLFTSTNQSNGMMQGLLAKRGYIRSGTIDNLDIDDPEWVYIKWMQHENH